MTNQNNWVHAPVNVYDGSATTRVRDFVRMNPPEFIGSQTNDDTSNLLDDIKNIFEVMNVSRNNRVELASYQFKDFAHI